MHILLFVELWIILHTDESAFREVDKHSVILDKVFATICRGIKHGRITAQDTRERNLDPNQQFFDDHAFSSEDRETLARFANIAARYLTHAKSLTYQLGNRLRTATQGAEDYRELAQYQQLWDQRLGNCSDSPLLG
jgi:hypothetical protein